MKPKYVPPSVRETAFNCPHCRALAQQFWYGTSVHRIEHNAPPKIVTSKDISELLKLSLGEDNERRNLFQKLSSGRPFFHGNGSTTNADLGNVFISACYNCHQKCLWVYDKLMWPISGEGPPPNEDLPDDVRRDCEEASTILNTSPRGAAALLRLAIQRLCVHLGQKGKNLNDDIAALVAGGLDARVQKALDVVRVIGNNAVHPGHIDLNDDKATAEKLFGLVNLISEVMISQPKHIDENLQ